MTHWDIPWLAWLVATLASFGLIEASALIHRRPDRTLSDRLRAWLGISPRRPWIGAGLAVFIGFFVWFIPHVVAG
jgi:hypothetical protein